MTCRTSIWSTQVSIFKGDFSSIEVEQPLFFLGKARFRWRRHHTHTIADPFLFTHGGKIWLFVESMRWFEKGKIAAFSSNSLTSWESHGIVLSEKFHLSYPQVFEEAGRIWMIPESHESGAVWLYSCHALPGPWDRECRLIEETLSDATIAMHGGRWYIWATDAEKRLRLYHAANMKGPYQEHPSSPVAADLANSRCGGSIIRLRDGTMLRPAQDCKDSYGHGLGFYKVDELSPARYRESLYAADALPRSRAWSRLGAHHVSFANFKGKDVVATDGLSPDLFVNLFARIFWNVVSKAQSLVAR